MTRILRLAGALALAVASTAAGSATADPPESTGRTCELHAVADPTGQINQDPHVRFGRLGCGPWTAVDLVEDGTLVPSASPGPQQVEVLGWVQVNNSAYGVPAWPSARCAGSGVGAAAASCLVSYTAADWDNVFVCTQVTITGPGGHVEIYQYDDDDNAANGNQCALQLSVAGPGDIGPVPLPEDLAGDGIRAVNQLYDEVRDRRGDVAEITAPIVREVTRTSHNVQELNYYVDAIRIDGNFILGARATYEGVFSPGAGLWTCTETNMATVPTVTCDAVDPDITGIEWDCGVMHVSATALRHTDPDTLQTTWGRVAGYVACDGLELATDQANVGAPYQRAERLMGRVTRIVCRAQLAPGLPTGRPDLPYSVVCVDPPPVG